MGALRHHNMEKFDEDCFKIHGIVDTDSESSSGKSDFDDDYYKLKPPPIKNIGNRQIVKISELSDRLKPKNDGGNGSKLSTANKLLGTDVSNNSTPLESNVKNPKKKISKKKKKRLEATKNDNKNLPICPNKNEVTTMNGIVTIGVSSKLLSNCQIEAKSFSKPEVVEILHETNTVIKSKIDKSKKSNVAGRLDDIVDVCVLSKSSNKIETKSFSKPEVTNVSHKLNSVKSTDIVDKSNKNNAARCIDDIVDMVVLSKSSYKIETKSFNKPEVTNVSQKINAGKNINDLMDRGILSKSLQKSKKAKSFNKPEILEVPYNNREVINGKSKESIGNSGDRFNRVLDVSYSDKLKQNLIDNTKGLGGKVSASNKPTQSIACSSLEKELRSETDTGVAYETVRQRHSKHNLSIQTCERAIVNLSYEEISNRDLSYNGRTHMLREVQENTYHRKIQTVGIVTNKNLSHNDRIEQIMEDANEQRLAEIMGIHTTYNNKIIYLYSDEETENSIQCVRHNYRDEVPDESICSGVFYALLFSAIHSVLLECFYSIL